MTINYVCTECGRRWEGDSDLCPACQDDAEYNIKLVGRLTAADWSKVSNQGLPPCPEGWDNRWPGGKLEEVRNATDVSH